MKKYRIVREIETYTNKVEYCIEVYNKEYLWGWWEAYSYYPTYEEAKYKIGELTQEIIREVLE
jgi:hypothetical protein